MTAVLEAPAATPVQAPRRPRWPLRLAALGALLGLAWTGALVWAPGTLALRAGTTGFGGQAAVVTVPGYGARGTDVVDYADGATVELTVPLRNDGPLPVTVTSAGTGEGVLPLLEVRDVVGLPLDLAPGERGEVVLRGVLTNCAWYHEREIQNLDRLRLGVAPALPLAATTALDVPLERPVLVHSPMIVGCPDRKLDRQANDRRDVAGGGL